MKVNNFLIQQIKKETILSADFIFDKPFGTGKDRYLSHFLNLKRIFIEPKKFLKKTRAFKKTIWFKIPTKHVHARTGEDAFFTLSLGLAFFLNEDLYFDGVVSQDLIEKTSQIREYFDYGNFKKKIRITYQVGKSKTEKRKGEAQFFSLGIDSFHTLLCYQNAHKKTSRYLVYVDGYDVPLKEQSFLKDIHSRISEVASTTANHPLFIQTNLREISDNIIGWGQYHVSALAAVAMLLPFQKMYIAGESFDAPDWGLRTGVDTLFSIDDLSLKLIGHNIPRNLILTKLKKSRFFDLFLNHVRVCWINVESSPILYNCSICQKCLRTQLTLIALGYENIPTFNEFDIQALKNIQLNSHVYSEWQTLYKLLKKNSRTSSELLTVLEELLNKPFVLIPHSYKTYTV